MRFLITISLALFFQLAFAQVRPVSQMDDGENSFSNSGLNRQTDSLKNKAKEFPKGLKVWTVDRLFGEREEAEPDTVQHLFQNSIFTNGLYGEYNNLGNVGSPRINRIFTDRFTGDDFIFAHPYDFFITQPEDFHFTNTLSPITNLSFNTCGSGNNGEDHLKALFAVNAGKKLGVGMKFDYIYGKGYYQNGNTAHFNYSLYGSYLGDRYNAHFLMSLNHQKVAESGGITNDEYILHPESFNDNYSESEIPVFLSNNWNRNDNQTIFFSHRYSFGYNRKVPMTEEEIAAKKFALKSKADNDAQRALARAKKEKGEDFDLEAYNKELAEKKALAEANGTEEKTDTSWLKNEYVPVTSIVHTLDFTNYKRIYQAYNSPRDYYANTFYNTIQDRGYANDSIYDLTKHFCLKNTLALAMLEGFNKWVPMGLKLFASHELRHYSMPGINDVQPLDDGIANICAGYITYNENNISIGGQIQKTKGKMFHYRAQLEAYIAGGSAGDIYLDGSGDFNLPLFGDTVSLTAMAFLKREAPTYYYTNYHSKHIWWDKELESQTKTHLEGLLDIGKTRTKLRVAVDNVDKLAYFSHSYELADGYRKNSDVTVNQSGNVSVFTAQLMQRLNYGPLNLETQVTYQKSTDEEVIAVPDLNIYANLFLKFRIAKVLATELGADVRYFTSYYAPDYSPTLGTFCSQGNGENNVKVGNYPIINVYANFHLKHARFFVMMSHVNATAGNYFLTPHYPQNTSLLRFGVSWNFFN